jgi:hypothetical protein
VSIKYIHGRTAILTIYYNTTNEKEASEIVHLHDIDSKPALHQLFVDKGFVRKKGSAGLGSAGAVRDQRRDQEVYVSSVPASAKMVQILSGMCALGLVVMVLARRARRRTRN